MSSSPFFDFEHDFVASLRCIPMQVRLKLDTCGIKLSLAQWHRFSSEERQQLVELPCDLPPAVTHFRQHLNQLVQHYQSEPAKTLAVDPQPPWLDANTVPPPTQAKAADAGCALTLAQWQRLSPVQRFALIKLSRPGHENQNFVPALQEFGLL